MKKNFNTKTITIKIDSVTIPHMDSVTFSKDRTELLHDSICMLNGYVNPLNVEYKFTDGDMVEINEIIKEYERVLIRMKKVLDRKKGGDIYGI